MLERQNRSATSHRFNHHQAERLRPVDGEQQRQGAGEKRALGNIVDFSDELDLRSFDERGDGLFKIILVRAVDFGSDLSGIPAALEMAIARSTRFSGEMRPRKAR